MVMMHSSPLSHQASPAPRAAMRAACLLQAATRRRRLAKEDSVRHAAAAIFVQRHARRWAEQSANDRPFVLRLRRQLFVFMLTPLVWLIWMLFFSHGVPFFWPRAVLSLPLIVLDALSITAYLQLGPAWCRGEFLATLALRASAIVVPMIVLANVAQQATSSTESVKENAAYFLEVSKSLGISVGVLMGLLPAARGRYFYIGAMSACLAVDYLRLWNHADGGIMVLLAPPLLCALCGHLAHITLTAALRLTVGREEAMGDLRRMLDEDRGAVELVDTADITLKWMQGPLTTIYKWGVLVGLVCHACDVGTACWAHGCYAADEPSIFCVRYVLTVLTLCPTWLLLAHAWHSVPGHEVCGVVALAHTFYAGGCIAVTLGGAFFSIASAPKCETTLTGVPAPLEGPLGLFAPQELHTVIRVCRNLVLAFLATAQPTTERHRGLNVALTIGCVVLSEQHAAPWADVRVVASVFGALLTYLGLHGALGASWQREDKLAQLEMRRREQLHTKIVSNLRRAIDAEQEPAETLPGACPPPDWLVNRECAETAPPPKYLSGLPQLVRGVARSSRHSVYSSYASSRHSCSSKLTLASIHERE